MSKANRFAVPLSELDAVHVAVEDQVEETDLTPPVPDLAEEHERQRLGLLRNGGAGI